MPKNKPLATSAPPSIETAWRDGDEAAVVSAVVSKYARVLDMTDSGRDIKPLASGMFEAMDRLRAIRAGCADGATPLAEIIAEAEKITANA